MRWLALVPVCHNQNLWWRRINWITPLCIFVCSLCRVSVWIKDPSTWLGHRWVATLQGCTLPATLPTCLEPRWFARQVNSADICFPWCFSFYLQDSNLILFHEAEWPSSSPVLQVLFILKTLSSSVVWRSWRTVRRRSQSLWSPPPFRSWRTCWVSASATRSASPGRYKAVSKKQIKTF